MCTKVVDNTLTNKGFCCQKNKICFRNFSVHFWVILGTFWPQYWLFRTLATVVHIIVQAYMIKCLLNYTSVHNLVLILGKISWMKCSHQLNCNDHQTLNYDHLTLTYGNLTLTYDHLTLTYDHLTRVGLKILNVLLNYGDPLGVKLIFR